MPRLYGVSPTSGDKFIIKHVKIEQENSGAISEEQAIALDNMFKVCAYSTPDISQQYDAFKKAFNLDKTIPAIEVILNPTSLSFISLKAKEIKATIKPSYSTDKLLWYTNAPDVAIVQDGIVRPVGNGDAVITAQAGNVSAQCQVHVDIPLVKVYTITNNLTNCSTNNSVSEIIEGGMYQATLTAQENYVLLDENVSIMMDEEDIARTAYADGKININNVTGNIVITAEATEADGGITYVEYLKPMDATSYVETPVLPNFEHKYEYGVEIPKDVFSGQVIYGSNMYDLSVDDTTGKKWYMSGGAIMSYKGSIDPWNGVVPLNMCLSDGIDVMLTCNARVLWDKIPTFPNVVLHVVDSFDVPSKKSMQKVYDNINHENELAHGEKDITKFYDQYTLPIIKYNLFTYNSTPSASKQEVKSEEIGSKLYYFRAKDKRDKLIADMWPVTKNGKPGMYDKISKVFYEGIGTFEVGGVVDGNI